MTGFHDHSDRTYLSKVKVAAPEEFAAWAELIAIACAQLTQCVYTGPRP